MNSNQSIETRRKYFFAFVRGVLDAGKGILSIKDMFKIIEKELDKIYPAERTTKQTGICENSDSNDDVGMIL